MTTVAVIGCAGNFGAKRLAALRRAGAHVAAVCDVAEIAEPGGARVERDWRTLLDQEFDVACIALPDAAKIQVVEEFLRAGKSVVVEKPLAPRVRDVRQLFNLAREHGRALYVGYNLRFFPSLQRLLELLRSGTFGELLQLRAFYGHGGAPHLAASADWRVGDRTWGGSFVDMGTHLLSLAAEAIATVDAGSVQRQSTFTGAVEDSCTALLRAGDSVVTLSSSWTAWRSRFSLELYGRDGVAELEGLVKYVKYGQEGERLRWGRRAESGAPELEETLWTLENTDPASAELEYLDAEWRWLEDRLAAGTYDMEHEERVNTFVADVLERFYT
jgi:predicted dehydrogenase